MESMGNEISQKVRSAIKAKLVDLGAYVDDELPDYIMVMVANKKTKDQMTDDLNLFLSDNTEKFTTWLSALLEKLHSMATEATQAVAPPAATEAPENMDTAQKTPVQQDTQPNSGDQPDDTTETAAAKKADPPGNRKRVSDSRSSTISTAPQTVKKSRLSDGGEPETEVQPDIVLAAEKDALFEEEVENSSKVASKTVIQKPASKTTPPARKDPARFQAASSRHPEKSEAASDPATRRRRPLTSAIGAVVVKTESLEPDTEEEYDPFKPAIGKVASKVKVTERKSKVPHTWQADKQILLKAVNAAQVSIEKTHKTQEKEKAVVKPVSRESSHRHSSSRVHHRLSRRSPERGMRSDHRHGDRHGDRHRRSPPRDHRRHDRHIQVLSRSKDSDVFARLRTKARKEGEEGAKDSGKEEVRRKRPAEERAAAGGEVKDKTEETVEDLIELSVPEDSRLIEYELGETPSAEKAYKSRPAVGTLIESGAEESDFTDGEGGGEDSRYVREKEPSARPPSPKFVVTLDGVDPDLLKKDVKFGSELGDSTDPRLAAAPGQKLERNIVRVEPFPQRPPIAPVTVNLGEDDEVDEDGDSIMMEEVSTPGDEQTGSTAALEKCHFYPACRNGDNCPYHHPSENCKNFPRCKFGDKCLYIHPKCKFDATCSKPACPFTHTTKRRPPMVAPTVPVIVQPIRVPMYAAGSVYPPPPRGPRPQAPNKHPSQVTCKFYPKCTNMNCPFNHPKPCRFGIACTKKNTCLFSHPGLPSKDQMTWSQKTPKKDPGLLASPGLSPVVATETTGPLNSTLK